MPILRIVKMTFREAGIETFLQIFNEKKSLIRDFEGCTHLELWQDKNDFRIFFTYSAWNSEASLENYRKSEFFRSTWIRTKELFEDDAEAWTLIVRSS